MMNKSLRARGRESSSKRIYGFRRPLQSSCERHGKFRLALKMRRKSAKKEPPFPAAFEVDNREASNRVDRSHSVSKEDDESHT
jgi:hypothetical protein